MTTITMFPFLCSFLFSSKVIFALFFVYLVFYSTFSVVKHTRKSNNLPVFSSRIVILLYSLDWALSKSVLRIMLFQGIWSLKFQLPFFLLTLFLWFHDFFFTPWFSWSMSLTSFLWCLGGNIFKGLHVYMLLLKLIH